MERTLEDIALRRLGHGAVAVQVAVPLRILLICEMLVGPLVSLLVDFEVFLIPCNEIGIKGCDDGLALRPPELHILGVVLRREVSAVAEVDDAAVLLVPTPFVVPVENLHAEFAHCLRVWIERSRIHKEPGCLDAVARIDDAAGDGIDELALFVHAFEYSVIFF